MEACLSIEVVAYSSLLRSPSPERELMEVVQAIAADAARLNRQAGVTSVLLFDGAVFFQYLKGPSDGVWNQPLENIQ